MTYHHTIEGIMTAFIDGDNGDTYNQNRMTVHEKDNGEPVLVAYGWLKLAEYDSSDDTATVFTGHQSVRSRTVSRWLNEVQEHARSAGAGVVLSGESPTVYTPNDGTSYINDYVNFTPNHSAVEQNAIEEVVDSLDDVWERDLRL